jgi:hypothetical protein
MSFNRSLLTLITRDLEKKKKASKPKSVNQQKIGDDNPYYIDKSDIAGKGAFAKQFIPKGSPIDLLHQINQPGVDYDFTQLGKSYNHSEDPNTFNKLVGNQRYMVANQDIYPGQELTGDYRMQPDLEQPQEDWKMKNGGYTVSRSSDRKGKTHKVTGPDGTVKYFGDSKLGQHPRDPERKAAFYARHKKNLDGNPFFRAFARATWQTGGQVAYADNTRLGAVPRYPRPSYVQPQTFDGFIKGADVLTDLMQLGHFIPHPVPQAVALAGDYFGAGIDSYQAIDEALKGNYGASGINAASAFLPSYLKSAGYLRDMNNAAPGSIAAKIANLGSKDGTYRPLTALPRLSNKS